MQAGPSAWSNSHKCCPKKKKKEGTDSTERLLDTSKAWRKLLSQKPLLDALTEAGEFSIQHLSENHWMLLLWMPKRAIGPVTSALTDLAKKEKSVSFEELVEFVENDHDLSALWPTRHILDTLDTPSHPIRM